MLTLTVLVAFFPLFPAYGLEVPAKSDTAVPNSGVFSRTSAMGNSVSGWMFDAALNLVTVAAVPASAIRFVPLVMGVIQSVPDIKSVRDNARNSAIEGMSSVITPAINRAAGFVPVPADALRIIENVNEDVTSGKSRSDTGIFGGYHGPIPETQGFLQPIDVSDNAAPFPYTYRYEQQDPVQQPVEQNDNSSVSLRPYARLQQVPTPETSWDSWNFQSNDSGGSGTVAPAVQAQVEQPASAPWTDFSAFNGNSSNRSLFSELPADDAGPYNWASTFYSLPTDLGQGQQYEWDNFDTNTDGEGLPWWQF